VGNRFHEGMPSYLLALAKNKRELYKDDQDDGKIVKKKHRDLKGNKNKFRDLGKMVKNTQAVQVWILPGHKYKSIFTGK